MNIIKAKQLQGHKASVYCIEQGATANIIYTGAGDQVVIQWDLGHEEEPKIVANVGAIVYSLCYIPQKNYLIIGESKGGIHILDLNAKKEVKFFVQSLEPVFDIKYSALNKALYTASGDGSLSVWSLINWDEDAGLQTSVRNIPLCKEKVRALDINANETHLAVACGDGTIRIFNLHTMIQEQQLEGHQGSVYSVKFHPDGRHLLSGGKDAILNIWDLRSASVPFITKNIPAHNFAIYSIVFSPNLQLFATASRDKTVKVWDAASFEIIKRLDKDRAEGHLNSVNKLVWTDFKDFLISASDDRSLIIWQEGH